MKFSVIVPVYNVEQYLSECVQSILNQTYKDFELILVDDGSPDNSPQICDDFAEKDSRVKVVHKENGGLSDARNTGISVAQGDYLLFVDSDDYYATNTVLETIANEIDEKNVDIVQFHRMWFYEKNGSLVEKADVDSRCYEKLSKEDTITTLIKNKMVYFSACQNAISREFILKNNLYFVKGIKSEDIEWGFRLFASLPSILLLPYSFYVYRASREGSISTTVDYNHLLDYCSILENSVELIEKGNDEIKPALMSHCMYHALICSAHTEKAKLTQKQKKEIKTRLKNLCKDRITKYTIDSRVNLASKVYKLVGFNVMFKVLGVYLSNRGTTAHSFKTNKI